MSNYTMNRRLCSVATGTEEEHRAYQVVQILKNDFIDDTQSSDGFETIGENTSTTRTKTKKSLFATLIKRKHNKRPKMKITKKIETCSTINFGTESVSSDQELERYQLSAETTQTPLSKVSSQSKKPKNYNFFRKIIKGSKVSHLSRKSVFSSDKTAGSGDPINKKPLHKVFTLSNFIPTTYIPKYNIKLINGMNELQDILHNLHHSEAHVVYLLKKFIEDKNVQKQLFEASFEYFSLQFDSKCQGTVLADKLWLQQVEIAKSQEYDLQKRLNFLVKTNRTLQFQIETLCRHCEKLAARSNVYPKRFLHMRSFGKIYARQLIENNRKLHNKMRALTSIIADFEEELQKLQQQKGVLEDEKRCLRSDLNHLEGILQKQRNDCELEKSQMLLQLNHEDNLMKDSVAAVHIIFQDLHDFEQQLLEVAITVTWPSFQYQDTCLPEMIYQVRGCVGELILTLITAYKGLSIVAKDVSKLRNTNTRLQENLQKSTNELDNLSKKLEKNVEVDFNGLESHCQKLDQENHNFRLQLESAIEQNNFLKEEVEHKKKTLGETKSSINNMMLQNQSLSNQIDEILQSISQLGPRELPRELGSGREKLEYLRIRYNQMVTDRKHLVERCQALEKENQNLEQMQEVYQQDLDTLQDGLTILSAENESVKKQLATEHQTVTTLQNERIKYLEEKNILKTIFQHLKSEVSRIQQLEGAVADMNKETSRLSLIAEFNKQLGEQLKSEVETKENTITELRQSLEKLSHIQIDSDREKMTLCAQLSEISTVKEKLSDCLEVELKKNMHLDETKKKLESSTKSQLKIYEEMQKNERAALKELLKDFKNLIKQRDCLVLLQEEAKKNYKDLEKCYLELRKQYESALARINHREEEMHKVVDTLQEQADKYHQLAEVHACEIAKYEKNVRKMEKLLGQMRNDKSDTEMNNVFLKNALERLQSDLNDAKEKVAVAENQLNLKSTECESLESEINSIKSELQILNQEKVKMVLELEYSKKMHAQQASDLKETISNYSTKDNMYLETQTTVLSKDQQIYELNKVIVEKEADIKRMEQDCSSLTKQIEDQNKIMMGYENHLVMLQDVEATKLNLEKESSKIQLEHKSTLLELENAQKEIQSLKNEMKNAILKNEKEKTFYKNQTSEIMFEYSAQKSNIEEEIDNISSQLRTVTDSLHSEKKRFDDLAKAHEDLKDKYYQLKDSFNSEVTAHKETYRKIEGMDCFIKAIATERDNLQQQVHLLVLEINEEKETNMRLSTENQKIQHILDQGRQQYAGLLDRNAALEEEVKELKYETKAIMNAKVSSQGEFEQTLTLLEEKKGELKSSKEIIETLKKDLHESQRTLIDLKEEFFKIQQHVTGLEFKNCELTLQLHETQGKLETERNLYKELKVINKTPGQTPPLAPSECGELFY